MNEDEARKLGRAFAEGVLETLLGRHVRTDSPAPAPALAEPRWMKIGDYAKRRGFSRTTVQAWIAEGMPATPMKRGYRVDARAADEWVKAGGAARTRQDA